MSELQIHAKNHHQSRIHYKTGVLKLEVVKLPNHKTIRELQKLDKKHKKILKAAARKFAHAQITVEENENREFQRKLSSKQAALIARKLYRSDFKIKVCSLMLEWTQRETV